MRPRVGVAVAHDAVRAVVVRSGTAVWAAEVPLEPDSDLASTVTALLREAPIAHWPRPSVSAVIGPHASQVKVLTGLPAIAEPEMLTGLVRESAGAFFLKNGVPLVTTGARPVGDAGAALAAAIDRPYIESVRDACRARGWTLQHIAPTAIALPLALEQPHFTWSDGRIVLEIDRTIEGLMTARSRAVCAVTEPTTLPAPSAVPGLAALGADAIRYADAYGATLLNDDETLAVDLRSSGLFSRTELLRPFLVPILIAVMAVTSILLSPLGAVWAGKRAEARIAEVRPGRWQVIRSALAQLDRVSAILSEAAVFANSRSSATDFLGGLARALPAGSMLASLEFTDEGGLIVALTTDAGAVVAAIRGLPGVTSTELVGPVAQEPLAGRPLQRVTVRFGRSVAR